MPHRPAGRCLPTEKIAKSLDLLAQRRKGCPLLFPGGLVIDQLALPIAQHARAARLRLLSRPRYSAPHALAESHSLPGPPGQADPPR